MNVASTLFNHVLIMFIVIDFLIVVWTLLLFLRKVDSLSMFNVLSCLISEDGVVAVC